MQTILFFLNLKWTTWKLPGTLSEKEKKEQIYFRNDVEERGSKFSVVDQRVAKRTSEHCSLHVRTCTLVQLSTQLQVRHISEHPSFKDIPPLQSAASNTIFPVKNGESLKNL